MTEGNSKPNIEPVKMLSARIVTDELFRYNLRFFEDLPDLPDIEYVRLFIYYYSRALYSLGAWHSFGESGGEISRLVDMVNRSISVIRESREDFIYALGEDISVIDIPPMVVPKKIALSLLFVDPITRKFEVDISVGLSPSHIIFSVAVLLKLITENISSGAVSILSSSVLPMKELVKSGKNLTPEHIFEELPENILSEGINNFWSNGSEEFDEPVFSTIGRICKTYEIVPNFYEIKWIIHFASALANYHKSSEMESHLFYATCAVALHESLFNAGVRKMKESDFNLALSSFQKAENLIEWPSVSYALGVVLNSLGQNQRAYSRFIDIEYNGVDERVTYLNKILPRVMKKRDVFENFLARILDKQTLLLGYKEMEDLRKAAKKERIKLESKNPGLSKISDISDKFGKK